MNMENTANTSRPDQQVIKSEITPIKILAITEQQPTTITNENINPKKRKLDEYNDCNNNKPPPKKRKFNDNSIHNQLNALIESNKLLKEENNKLRKERAHYKQGRSIYRKEVKKWKLKYIKLYSQLQNDITSDNNNTLSASPTPPPSKYFHKPRKNTIHDNKNNMNYDSIRDRLLKMGFDKNQVINRISIYNNSGETPQFVFDQLLNTFTPGGVALKNENKFANLEQRYNNFGCNKHNDGAVEYVEFEDSYVISVKCYICQQHFDNINQYTNHLEQHYKTDATKTWLKCNFGCNKKQFASRHQFIQHITSHTNDKTYKCNINNCREGYRYKSNIKRHWECHFKTKQNNHKRKTHKNKRESSESESELESDDNMVSVEFEKSYFISVDCHVCKQHFDDFAEYRNHIRQHYFNDPNKKWMECDFGCKDGNNNAQKIVNFICHIASHTKEYPFHCNVENCKSTSGTKSNLKSHWNSRHNKKYCRKKKKIYAYEYGSAESDDESSSSSQSN